MKKTLILFFLITACQSNYSKSDQYYQTIEGHIVQTFISGDCNSKCINSIVNSDLKYATYAQSIYVLDEVSKKLPNIFKGVKRELSIQIEEKFKKSVLK